MPPDPDRATQSRIGDGPRVRLALPSKSEPSVTPVRTEDVAIGGPRLSNEFALGSIPADEISRRNHGEEKAAIGKDRLPRHV